MNAAAVSSNLTLIVGAGPAGSSCAWKLASGGRPCLVLDRSRFPRDKVCAGVLSARASSILLESGLLTADELEGLTLAKHFSISFWNGTEHLRSFTSISDPLRIVSRAGFDSLLLEKAAGAGADVVTGEAVETLDRCSALTSSGNRISFGSIVGADGCSSRVRRLVTCRRGRGTGMGLEYLVPLSDMIDPPDCLEIHFGYLPYGYVWVFPDSEKVNIGAGVVGSPASPSNVIEALQGFMKARGLSHSDYGLRGAPIPSLSLDGNLGRDNVYLAGDAAGLVDQVSGEGIGHALESGIMAAGFIAEGGRRAEVLKRKGNCIDIVKQSALCRHLLFGRPLRRTAMLSLRDNEEFARGYWNIISGTETYAAMLRRILG